MAIDYLGLEILILTQATNKKDLYGLMEIMKKIIQLIGQELRISSYQLCQQEVIMIIEINP